MASEASLEDLAPMSPELILVSPPEIARLARDRLPGLPWVVYTGAAVPPVAETPPAVVVRPASPSYPEPIVVKPAPEPARPRLHSHRLAAALAFGLVAGFVAVVALAIVALAPPRRQVATSNAVASARPSPAAKIRRPPSARSATRQTLASPKEARPLATGSHSVRITQADHHVIRFSSEPLDTQENVHSSGGTTPALAPNATEPPPPPIKISDVHTVSLSPLSATIAWRTSEAATSQVAYGLDTRTMWSAADAPSVDHVAIINGLSFNTTYRLWVDARSDDGRTVSAPFLLTTRPLSGPATGGTGGGAFLVNGQPYFPTMVWAACPDAYATVLAAGIDLILGKGCGSAAKQIGALAGRGLLASDATDPAANGAIGTFLPDEWDTYLPNNLTPTAARGLAPNNGGGPRFLTLTNHFYSRAAPLPQGRGMYPALVQTADVLGFDLYPLQNWCRWDSFGDIFDSQRELVRLAKGKPTFQWIEARAMDCHDLTLNPTPATVHAEAWLAIAGGAHAIGYFPYDFSSGIGAQIASDKRELQALVPALLEPALPASAGDGPVKVGARQHNGAIYVIAINASRVAATATITVPGLADRQLLSLDGSRSVRAAAGMFTDTFAPLEVHVYIAAPQAP